MCNNSISTRTLGCIYSLVSHIYQGNVGFSSLRDCRRSSDADAHVHSGAGGAVRNFQGNNGLTNLVANMVDFPKGGFGKRNHEFLAAITCREVARAPATAV